MKIGAYQFAVGADMTENLHTICRGITEAAKHNIRLPVFPECALTGYPPRDIKSSANVNFEELNMACREIEKLAKEYNMYILVGAITKEKNKYYNSARLITPDGKEENYHKRALWGWDKENFSAGNKDGIVEIDGIKIGVRICFMMWQMTLAKKADEQFLMPLRATEWQERKGGPTMMLVPFFAWRELQYSCG